MKLIYLYIILLLVGCVACKEGALAPKEELPPATQEGKNTFGCLVNGEVWVPKAGINPTIHRLVYEYHEGYFRIIAKRFFNNDGVSIRQSIGVAVESNLDVKNINYLNEERIKYGLFSDLEKACWYETNSTQTGALSITKLDTINHIIAGTFDFTVWTEVCDTIRITDGRFDIKYR